MKLRKHEVKKFFSSKILVVPAIPDSLPILRKFISQMGERYRFTKHEINAFRISIDEACTNIIKHGYQGAGEGYITMKVQANQNRLTVELIDQGRSFDPNVVNNPNVTMYVERGKKGGLGIFIMRKFLDAIEYEVTSIGNILRLTKFRQDNLAHPMMTPIIAAFKRLKEKFFSAQAA